MPKPTPAPAQKCQPSYVGACLDPNTSDYDCAEGSGNGPKYTGPVRVVGTGPFRSCCGKRHRLLSG